MTDADIARLQVLLDAVPAPLEPLDTMSLDGFLCGVLLQPQQVARDRWLRHVADVEGRAPPTPDIDLATLVLRRHAQLDAAIARRQWFDPWVYQLDDAASVADTVLPWIAGFATAMDLFPALLRLDHAELIPPLALLYRHVDVADLEDADQLIDVIETLEPPADLAEAVEDIVRAVLQIADVSRPRTHPPPGRVRR